MRRGVTRVGLLELALALAAAMVLCGLLSNLFGDWILYTWFIGAILIASVYCYGNNPPTYLMTGFALAWVYVLAFTDFVYPELGEPQRIEWSLQQDTEVFARNLPGNTEVAYRIDVLREAEQSNEYQRFARQVARAPLASRAFIYYESNPNASHYFFVLGLQNADGCRLFVSDSQGTREEPCEVIRFLDVSQRDDPRAIRDPLIAGFVQFRDDGDVRRVFGVVPQSVPGGMPLAGTLEDKIWRIFGG